MNSGDTCPACYRLLQVVNTIVIGASRKRYIGCRSCGYRPPNNVQVVPLEHAPRRQPQIFDPFATGSNQVRAS
jgi:hypothetical protein